MKKILLLCLLLSQFVFSQRNSITMSDQVIPIVEEYIKDGEDRGLYLRFYIIENINEIILVKDISLFGDNLLGITDKIDRTIYLSEDLIYNPVLFRLSVYQEIGHLLKYENYHSSNPYDIMSEYAPADLSPYYDNSFWEEKVDIYFDWLNSK